MISLELFEILVGVGIFFEAWLIYMIMENR